jgi:hypothetical protein
VFACVFAALALGDIGHSVNTEDARPALRTLTHLYNENRDGFQNFNFEFEFEDGFANNMDVATSGKLRDSYRTTGRYRRKDAYIAYTCVFPLESMAATSIRTSDSRLSCRLQSIRMVTNERATLIDHLSATPEGQLIRGNIIAAGSDQLFSAINFPLGLGFPDGRRRDLGNELKAFFDRPDDMFLESFDDRSSDFPEPTIRFTLRYPGGVKTYWADPKKNAIPIRTLLVNDAGQKTFEHYADIRFIQGHGWLPFEMSVLSHNGRCRRVRITKFDFSDSPADAFKLEFPSPIAMVDESMGLSYRPQLIWDLSDLPKRNSGGAQPLANASFIPDPPMPAERIWRFPYELVGISSVILIGLSVLLAKRRRGFLARS